MDTNFYTEVINSSKTLTARETLKVTDTRNAEKIDELYDKKQAEYINTLSG